MLSTIRHSSGTEQVPADSVAASSNHSDGRAAAAALTTVASSATASASHGHERPRPRNRDRCAVFTHQSRHRSLLPRFRRTVAGVWRNGLDEGCPEDHKHPDVRKR